MLLCLCLQPQLLEKNSWLFLLQMCFGMKYKEKDDDE